MARDVEYTPDNAGWAQIRNSPEILAACVAEAHRAQAIAEALSEPFTDTGDYASSFRVVPTTVVFTGTGVSNGPRAAARLENTSGHAAAVEWKNSVNGRVPHRVLGRTLEQLGGAG